MCLIVMFVSVSVFVFFVVILIVFTCCCCCCFSCQSSFLFQSLRLFIIVYSMVLCQLLMDILGQRENVAEDLQNNDDALSNIDKLLLSATLINCLCIYHFYLVAASSAIDVMFFFGLEVGTMNEAYYHSREVNSTVLNKRNRIDLFTCFFVDRVNNKYLKLKSFSEYCGTSIDQLKLQSDYTTYTQRSTIVLCFFVCRWCSQIVTSTSQSMYHNTH